MKYIGIIIAVILAVGIWLVVSRQHSKPTTNSTVTQAAKREYLAIVSQAKAGEAIIYDVRTQEEYAAGHFAEAINFPMQSMSAGELPEFTKDTPIYVYCRSGSRSHTAAELLKKAGFINVTDLGGLEAVKRIGGTLNKESSTL